MGTFSINIGTSTESMSYLVVGGTAPSTNYLNDILNLLEDNTSKEISPYVLRSAVLSLYSSVAFKETSASGSTTKYIGVDTLDPSGNDLKKKIYFGKRAFSGTHSYAPGYDIMNSTLLGSDVDIFLYNTKIDTIDNDTTKIGIISGTAYALSSPYFQSQFVTSPTHSLSLDFVATTGDLNITSDYDSILVNTIKFPTSNESYASASTSKTLFYQNGKLVWDDITLPPLTYIGTTGSAIQIQGSVVNLNEFPLDFSDNRMVPQQLNGILMGETFSSEGISEMLRRVIYPYLPPQCSIKLLSPYEYGYVEVGTFPTPTIEFTIKKKTLPVLQSSLTNMIPSIYPAFNSYGPSTVVSSSNGIVISPITASTTQFSITVTDGTASNSATTSLTGIYPFFYGFSTSPNMNSIGLSTLTKSVTIKEDKVIDISGTGNYFFVYDFDYGTLSNIYDSLGNTCSASFSATSSVFSSPSGLWAGKKFYVYQWNSVPQIGPPSQNFQFKF